MTSRDSGRGRTASDCYHTPVATHAPSEVVRGASTGHSVPMAETPTDARPPGEVRLDGTYEDAVPTVFRTAEWIPPAYRQAYLEGAASVLGREPLTVEP